METINLIIFLILIIVIFKCCNYKYENFYKTPSLSLTRKMVDEVEGTTDFMVNNMIDETTKNKYDNNENIRKLSKEIINKNDNTMEMEKNKLNPNPKFKVHDNNIFMEREKKHQDTIEEKKKILNLDDRHIAKEYAKYSIIAIYAAESNEKSKLAEKVYNEAMLNAKKATENGQKLVDDNKKYSIIKDEDLKKMKRVMAEPEKNARKATHEWILAIKANMLAIKVVADTALDLSNKYKNLKEVTNNEVDNFKEIKSGAKLNDIYTKIATARDGLLQYSQKRNEIEFSMYSTQFKNLNLELLEYPTKMDKIKEEMTIKPSEAQKEVWKAEYAFDNANKAVEATTLDMKKKMEAKNLAVNANKRYQQKILKAD